jgi:hypothetical protein
MVCRYGGQETGHGLADVLWGRVNPSGRLPLTFHPDAYKNQVGPVASLNMTFRDTTTGKVQGRTYRYLADQQTDALFSFGWGPVSDVSPRPHATLQPSALGSFAPRNRTVLPCCRVATVPRRVAVVPRHAATVSASWLRAEANVVFPTVFRVLGCTTHAKPDF